jgi:hypothetical protein
MRCSASTRRWLGERRPAGTTETRVRGTVDLIINGSFWLGVS